MNSREKERFISVDVADAGDHRLIEQRGLDRPATGPELPGQHGWRDVESIGPELRPAMRSQVIHRLEGPKPAEAARIAKHQAAIASARRECPAAVHVIGLQEWVAATYHAKLA